MFTRFLFCLPLIVSLTAALAQDTRPLLPPGPVQPGPGLPVLPGQPGLGLPVLTGQPGLGLPVSPVQPTPPCDCCGTKPKYSDAAWAPFTGTVAFVTQQAPPSANSPLVNKVLVAWDLHVKNGMPLNSWWNPSSLPATNYYSHGSWTKANLGDLFGMTLDNSGNIYVAATSIYSGPVGGGLSTGAGVQKMGQIYKIANSTSAPSAFRLLPSTGAGLGNLHYDCERNSLYATSFDTGLIYQLNNATGATLSTWDHGANLASAVDAAGAPLSPARPAIAATATDPADVRFTALGRRPWAVAVHQNRLYYSIINNRQDLHNGIPNEIWSVALDSTGTAMAPARLEIQLPFLGTNYSNPVSDITFGPMGDMFVAEHSMNGNSIAFAAHNSRALGYSFVPGTGWQAANPAAYKIGAYSNHTNAAGGVAIDFSPQGRYLVTGDALHLVAGDYLYGLQGFPAGGGDVTNSFLIDVDNYPVVINKYQLGVVRIPCPDCASPPLPPVVLGPQTACTSPSQYSVATPQAGVTYTWTVTGAASTSASTGTSINVNWTGVPGTVMVTANGPGTCGAVSSFVKVAACPAKCEFCNQFTRSISMANPIHQGSGLYNVTPTVSTTMPTTGVTMTLLNSTAAYSPAICGASGPLPSYMATALPSTTTAAINPPSLTVSPGNQAVWQASSAVNLGSGATTPFQMQLPTPPNFPPYNTCKASFSFCLRASFSNALCQTCDVTQCFGPYPYYTIGWPSDIASRTAPPTAESSFLLPLLTFIQNADTNLPQRFPIGDLTFEPNSATLTAGSTPLLASLAAVLTAYPTVDLQVEGLSGNSGDEAADRQLAQKRAETIADALKGAQVTNRIVAEAKGPFSDAMTAIVVLRK
jgi:outer membrane protein OmpA-like peptidoglycan-associated protein